MSGARRGRVFNFSSVIWLPQPPAAIFPFFSDASYLEVLTPPALRFRLLTPRPVPMGVGTRFDYRLRVHGIPLRWQSEITEWRPPEGFVDEQRRGPYRSWTHAHRFVALEGGTMIRDDVRYQIFGGALVDRLFVRTELEAIFWFRSQRLLERFGSAPGASGDLPRPGSR